MEKTREQLRSRFRTGMVPTESDFGDMIDSMAHASELAATNRSITQMGQDLTTMAQNVQMVVNDMAAFKIVQQLVKFAAGEFVPERAVEIKNKLKRVPCVKVFKEDTNSNENDAMVQVAAADVEVAVVGMEKVTVTVRDQSVGTGKCWVVLS